MDECRFQFQEESQAQMMAWVIGACYNIQVRNSLIIVDNRNVQLNSFLANQCKKELWQNVHLTVMLNQPEQVKPKLTKQESMLSAIGHHLQRQVSNISDQGTGFNNVKVDRDKLDDILTNNNNMLDYEESLFSFERSLNQEISKSRV